MSFIYLYTCRCNTTIKLIWHTWNGFSDINSGIGVRKFGLLPSLMHSIMWKVVKNATNFEKCELCPTSLLANVTGTLVTNITTNAPNVVNLHYPVHNSIIRVITYAWYIVRLGYSTQKLNLSAFCSVIMYWHLDFYIQITLSNSLFLTLVIWYCITWTI